MIKPEAAMMKGKVKIFADALKLSEDSGSWSSETLATKIDAEQLKKPGDVLANQRKVVIDYHEYILTMDHQPTKTVEAQNRQDKGFNHCDT
eukprot:g13271.t1